MNDVFQKAQAFIHRNARPLDLARWQYHFEQGGREAVLDALANYQNGDGGFGHALEADAWNPNSSPIQTWAATEILREIGFSDSRHPLVRGILRYLGSGESFQGHFWLNTIPSNNDYPHAPWWETGSESTSHHNYNPTACLAGFILRHAERESELFALGRRVAREAFDAFLSGGLLGDMHTALCYVRLLQYVQEACVSDVFDLAALRERLKEQVRHSVTRDTSTWGVSYVCKPSQFFNTRDSVFYESNREAAEFECGHILETQLGDGSWPIPWGWAGYPEAWALSRNWWASDIVIKNMRYLKGFGKLGL